MNLKALMLAGACGLCAAASLSAANWKLVWAEEFNDPGLPDKAKWGYEHGFVRNNELQFYTRDRQENARVEAGNLVIEARKEKFPNPSYKPGADPKNLRTGAQFADYTAASLVTDKKVSFHYGRIEVRAKLPQGKGIWPAIWMMGTNHNTAGWPKCGEIDIMEFVGKDPNNVHATVHFFRDGKHGQKGSKLAVKAPYDDFHVYAVEWFEDRMDFYFDQQKYHSFPLDEVGIKGADNPFRKPHYLLINLAMGGSWGGALDEAVLPQKYLIDYVRFYQQAP
jgi:beta-glucanase (GH16 family)